VVPQSDRSPNIFSPVKWRSASSPWTAHLLSLLPWTPLHRFVRAKLRSVRSFPDCGHRMMRDWLVVSL